MHWEPVFQVQPDTDALSVDDWDTLLETAVPEDLVMWQEGTYCTKLLAAGKLPRECPYPSSRGHSQAPIDARHVECVPTLSDITKSKAAYIQGKVNDHYLDILLDSGASCSVIRGEHVASKDLHQSRNTRLTNADGRELTTLGTTTVRVNLGNLEIHHNFTVVKELSAPAILGCDFLKKHGIVIDFQKNIVSSLCLPTLQAQLSLNNASMCTLVLDSDYPQAVRFYILGMNTHPKVSSLQERKLRQSRGGQSPRVQRMLDHFLA